MFKNWCLMAFVTYGAGFGSNFLISRNLSQSALAGLGTLPAVAASTTVLSRQRRREIERQISGVKARLIKIEYQEQSVQQQFQVQLGRMEELAIKIQSSQVALAEQSDCLEHQRSESDSLQQEIFGLQQKQRSKQMQFEQISAAITALKTEKQILESILRDLQQTKIVGEQQNDRIRCSILALGKERETVKLSVDRLTQIQAQKQTALVEAERFAKEKQQQKQQTQILLTQKVAELAQQHQWQEYLLSQLELEIDQKQEIVRTTEEHLVQIQEQLQQLSLDPSVSPVSLQLERINAEVSSIDSAPTEPKIAEFNMSIGGRGLYCRDELVNRPYAFADGTIQDFTNPQYAKKVWEERIWPYWVDRDKPKGQRFLGNVNISREQSEELMSFIGESLRPLKSSSKSLNNYKKFKSSSQDWIKIFTFALSEYAYYYSDDKFWEGLCSKWMLPYNQGVGNTLREITGRGIKILGLVEASDGYKYVSTMWLQSAIPHRNMNQFARLMQELSNNQSWDSLAQLSTKDLAQKILEIHDRRYPANGTLFRLLKHQPAVAGKIVSGVATIAKNLQDEQIELSVLADGLKGKELLNKISLENDFFIRDWEAVIKILEPKNVQKKHRSVRQGAEEAFLRLDVEDSENIQFVLPAQNIRVDRWSELRGSGCSIPAVQWKGCLDMQGNLSIPERIVDINQPQQVCDIELVSDQGDVLYVWQCAMVESVSPYLIFDAFSGSHLLTENDELVTDSTEIVCFVPISVKVITEYDASLLEDGISCSIKGWKGNRLELKGDQAVIRIQAADDSCGRSIHWQLLNNNEPRLTGLSLDTKPNYFEMPMLWLPPDSGFSQGEVKVIRIEDNEEVYTETFEQKAINSEKWQGVTLGSANLVFGKYRVDVSTESLAWSHEFFLKSQYAVISSKMELPSIYIDGQALADESLPYVCFESYEFNAKIIEIRGLWALELIDLILVSEFSSIDQTSVQADQQGISEIRMSELSEFWDQSAGWHELSYRRRGQQPIGLMRKESAANRFTSN
jgi:hypothetical protein